MSYLAPDTMQRFLDDNGVPLAGGLINTYIAGTVTPQATYTDSTLGTPNANPVVLDSGGKASIWLGAGLSYKFVIQTALGSTIKTIDNIVQPPLTPYAVNIGGTGVTAVATTPTASAWAGWDANKNFSANNFLAGFRSTATAAATTTLLVSDASQQVFTGTTTQTVVMPVVSGLVVGQQYVITNLSTGVVTVQSSGANTIQAMAANTQLYLTCISTSGTGTSSWTWTYVAVQNAIAGKLAVSQVFVDTGNGFGAVNSAIRRWLNTQINTGTAITYLDNANNGGTFTINTNGIYCINYSDGDTTGASNFGVSVNSSALTTAISSLTYAQGRRAINYLGSGVYSHVSATLSLSANDVIRAQTDASINDTTSRSYFNIILVALT